jgi:serine/threonine protein kinase
VKFIFNFMSKVKKSIIFDGPKPVELVLGHILGRG